MAGAASVPKVSKHALQPLLPRSEGGDAGSDDDTEDGIDGGEDVIESGHAGVNEVGDENDGMLSKPINEAVSLALFS